jgi:HK97 family phage prohead protease
MDTPRDDLIRMNPAGVTLGDDDGTRTLFGYAAVFNEWTEIHGWEGHFRERIMPGAFAKTIQERGDRVKILYDHGMDPTLGNKPLGKIRELREDDRGLYYEVALLDTDYNRNFLIPAVEADTLGASFRFRVTKDDWDDEPDMPERTIREIGPLHELGPVTFPAYEGATAGVRNRQDFELWRSLDERGRADFMRLVRQARDLATPDGEPAPEDGQPPKALDAEPRYNRTALRARIALLNLKKE